MHAETTLLPGFVAPSAAAAPVFARVDVYYDATPILDIWAELEETAPCSIYQTRAWLLPWIETLGRKAGIEPLFVLARDENGRGVALLPLGLMCRGPLHIAIWLGGSDSNFNLALARPGLPWSARTLTNLLRAAAKSCGRRRPDIFVLKNQPIAWHGQPNPLALLARQPSPSAAYGTRLPCEAEQLFAQKLSKDTRKKLRKKETKLAALGPLSHRVASTIAEQRVIVDAFLVQKVARFREKGIASEFDTPEMRRFIELAGRPSGAGIELHALLAGERIVAVYGGAAHDGQWSGMFNAFDGDEEIAKSSPGDLLLMRIIAKCCADGLEHLDLGIGEARYKAALCDEQVPLFDTVFATSLLGSIAAGAIAVALRAKRAVKKNPRFLALAHKLTRWV